MEKNRILREKIEDSFAKAKKAISDFAGSVQFPLNDSSLEHIIAALVKTTLAPERLLSSTDVENFRMVWSRNFSPEDVDKIVANLYESTVITVEEAAEVLSAVHNEYQKKIIYNLLELMSGSDAPDHAEKFLAELAEKLDFTAEEFKEMTIQAKNRSEKRKKLLSSGAGILAALIILLIFIIL